MIPRGKLDISYKHIVSGMGYCLSNIIKPTNVKKSSEQNDKMFCLSVRTGFHLVLTTLNLPPQSEIIVTDINIPDMFSIITAHQLIAVPVCVDKHTLNMSPQQIETAITPNTKAILITHLFGGIMDTEEIAAIAKRHNLVIIEDCAQAFVGDEYKGNSRSDVIMYSFGLIKTNTSATGAILQINSQHLFAEIDRLNNLLPLQANTVFFKKLLKVLFINLLTSPIIYSLFYKYSVQTKKDFDEFLASFTRGFPGSGILQKISYRPCQANIRLLEKRLIAFKTETIDKRRTFARNVLNDLPRIMQIGYLNRRHSYWVLPIEVNNSDEIVFYLRSKGFDATKKASSLVKIGKRLVERNSDELWLENLVYLPAFATMSKKCQVELAGLITGFYIYNEDK